MTVNITPLHDRVLVRRLEGLETAKGGIIIPDTAKEKPHEGEVIAVGAGKMEKGHRVALDVKVGDRILFGKYTGNDIKIEDQEYLILREEEILAIVGGAEDAVEADVAGDTERGGDMAMRQAADDGEGILLGRNDCAALQHTAQPLNVRRGPVGEIAQCALMNLATLAVALTQEDGGRRVPIRNGFDVHGET